ncbi:MAG: autotransporter outer membrane beta-barrel domain-containing protein [Chitinispirillaceae bacterium]|jgi:hypothetical protein
MKARLMAGVLGIVMAVSFAFAEDFVTSVAPGSKAMLFSFSGLSNLGANTFNGGLGGKYFLTDVLALRGSLNYGHSHADVYPDPLPVTGQTEYDGFDNLTTMGISVGAEYHFGKARVSPYAGGQFLLSYTTSDSKDAGTANPPNVFYQTEFQDISPAAGTTFQISALAGVEFFLTKELSLSAEYQFGFSSLSHSDAKMIQQTPTGTQTTTAKIAGSSAFNVSTTLLTLSVYF